MVKDHLRPLAALLIAAVVLWAPLMRGPIDIRWDAGVYYILGTSLARGEGYRILSEPGNPQAVQYPPLLPLLVAAHERVLGTSDPVVVGKWLRVTFQLMLMGSVVVTYVFARRLLSPWQAFAVGVIYLLSRWTYFLGSLCFADLPFMLVGLLFFLPRRSGWKSEVTKGFCAIAAYLLRTIGIALLVTWVAQSLIQRQWKRAALRTAVALVPLLLWQGYVNFVKASDAYQHPVYAYQRAPYQFYNVPYGDNLAYLNPYRPELGRATSAEMVERVARNLIPIVRTFGEAVSSITSYHEPNSSRRRYQTVLAAVLYGFSAAIIVGLAVLARRGEWPMIIYLALSILLIAATPWPEQFSRYFSPLVPFMAIGLVQGIAWAKQQIGGRRDNLALQWLTSVGPAAIVFAAVAAEFVIAVRSYGGPDDLATYVDARGIEHPYRLFFYGKEWRDFETSLDWLQHHAQPGAVVGTSCPYIVYLKLNLKAVMPPRETDVDKAQRFLDSVPVTYLIVDDLRFLPDDSNNYIRPVVQTHADRWKKVYGVPATATAIYQRVGAPPATAAMIRPSRFKDINMTPS